MAPADCSLCLHPFAKRSRLSSEHEEENLLQEFEAVESPTAILSDEEMEEEENYELESSCATTVSTVSSTPKTKDNPLQTLKIRRCLFPPEDESSNDEEEIKEEEEFVELK